MSSGVNFYENYSVAYRKRYFVKQGVAYLNRSVNPESKNVFNF